MDTTNKSTYELDTLCLKNAFNVNYVLSASSGKYTREDVTIRINELTENKSKLQRLLNLPKVEQKSEQWYEMRRNLITASDFAQALGQGKFGTQADIFKKKVRPEDESSASFSNPFFQWGNMFEPVANDVYSILHGDVPIYEFGLIPHPTKSFFGASPDGITEYGVMVEIKCPPKRKIEVGGAVPIQYFYQIQGQLEVCSLKECDYFECQFILYKTWDEFKDAFGDSNIKGIIIENLTDDGKKVYTYSPMVSHIHNKNTNFNDIEAWVHQHTEQEFNDIKFWWLSHYNLKRVEFDKKFVDEKLSALEQVWEKVLVYRNNPQKYELEVLKKVTIENTCRMRPITDFLSVSANTKTGAKVADDKEDEKVQVPIGYSFIDDPQS
jgi:putative phage-type endonuclease